MTRALAAILLLAGAQAASGHDTWISPGDVQAGLVQVRMQFGPHYPMADGGQAAASVLRASCVEGATGEDRTLLPRREMERFLELRTRADTSAGLACWAEQRPFDAELPADLVPTYFQDIRAPDAVAAAWSRQQARGAGWRESYRKFMRMEVPPREGSAPGAFEALRKPVGLGLEIIPLGAEPVRAGRSTRFRVLLDGRPLAGQWVQLVPERQLPSFWLQSDADGVITQALPGSGPWLLRATRLEVPAREGAVWHSRFSTLWVDVR